MEPFERDELTDGELGVLLERWKTPSTPEHLRAKVFPAESLPWWRRFWGASVPVPILAACCATILLAVAISRWMAPPRAEQPFLLVPYTSPLDRYDRTEVVRMNMPVSALIAEGFRLGHAEPGATVQTDVLVGQDGRVRAVRAVPGIILTARGD